MFFAVALKGSKQLYDYIQGAIVKETTGFFNLLATSGETFTKHFKMNLEEFSFYSLELMLEGIRNKASSTI